MPDCKLSIEWQDHHLVLCPFHHADDVALPIYNRCSQLNGKEYSKLKLSSLFYVKHLQYFFLQEIVRFAAEVDFIASRTYNRRI